LIRKIEHSITVTDGRIPEKPRTKQSSVEECKDSSPSCSVQILSEIGMGLVIFSYWSNKA
jgi:hypothetical protein